MLKLILECEKESPVQVGIVLLALIDKQDLLTLTGSVTVVDNQIVVDHFSRNSSTAAYCSGGRSWVIREPYGVRATVPDCGEYDA